MALACRRLQGLITKLANPMFRTRHAVSNQNSFSSYNSSPFLVDIEEPKVKYEVTKDPADWKYVERVLPIDIVPEVTPKPEYPSGWKPPAADANERPYAVLRNKNHMMPVYLKLFSRHNRSNKRHTVIKRIHGDIWQLEKELRPFIAEQVKPQNPRIQVDEFAARINIGGDHVNAVKYWLSERGF